MTATIGKDLVTRSSNPPPRHGAVVLVCVGGALTALDLTIVNVALPRIGGELGTGLSGLQWVVNAYTLAFASLILTAGAVADRVGDRAVFGTGVAVFTAGSLGCGLAPGATALIAFRVVQGVGAAMILATSISLLARVYEGRRRAGAITAWVTAGTVAANLGPIVGGVLVDGLGWRGVFLVNVPIGVLLLVALPFLTGPGAAAAPAAARRLDVGGAVLAALALFALNYVVVTGPAGGWGRPEVVVAAVVAVAAGAAFVTLQRHRRERALLDLRLFAVPSFTAAILLSLLSRMTSFGALPFFVIWLEGVLGLSAAVTGAYLLALSLPVLVVAMVSTRLQRLASARVLIASGNLCAALGALALLLLVGPDSGPAATVPGFALIGLGAGLIFPSLMGIAVGVVEPARAGIASGMANTFFPLGTALGVAVFGVVSTVTVEAAGLTGAARTAALSGDLTGVGPEGAGPVGDAVVTGLHVIAGGMALLSLLAVVVAVTLVRDADRVPAARA